MIFDLHNDNLTAFPACFDRSPPPALQKSVIYAIFTTQLTDPLAFFRRVMGAKPDYLAVEDLGFLDGLDGRQAEGLNAIKNLAPVYASLTWNGENSLAGGAHTQQTLTKNGKIMLSFLKENGIILDTAHLSRPAFFAAADENGDSPILCSHTCFNGVYSHPRNLTDRQIKVILDRKGIVGLTLVPEFMGKKIATPQDVATQIDYFTQKFGADSLAIGTDFFGTDSPAIKDYKAFENLESILTDKGYSAETIQKIFYSNAANFINKNKK